MRIILTLVRKDIATFLRNRPAVVITFLVPVALIYIFGFVFGLNARDSGPAGIRLGVVNASDSPAAQQLVDALKAEKTFRVVTADPTVTPGRPLTEADARRLIHDRKFNFALVIPSDFIPARGVGLRLRILSDPRNEIETQTVNGLLQKTIFSHVPQLLGQALQAGARRYLGDVRTDQFNSEIAAAVTGAFGGDREKTRRSLEAGGFGALPGESAAPAAPPAPDLFSRLVQIETVQVAGRDVKSPAATRVVGGWAMMFLLFAVSGGSAAFFDEKNAGLFQRLLSAPVRRSQLLWSRFIYGILLGLVQLTTLFAAGRLLYGIDVFGHFGNLVVVCTAAAAACSAFGMLIAAFAPNAQAANGLATFLVLTMSATGGAWFPISLMPEFMQHVAKFTLVYWSMEGFSQVLWAGSSLGELLPTVGILLAIAAGVMAAAVWRFNRGAVFD
ncbi:MAG: ABC transporter permease [Opitutae bacterium]|nr:ABC transporter permease [Opitutae bacterium]